MAGKVRFTLRERFEQKVERVPFLECWVWVGALNLSGYGAFMIRDAHGRPRSRGAHRVAYGIYRGEIPDGLVLDHLCRHPWCVNPWHLEPVTQHTNLIRGVGFVSQNLAKTHCPKGHAYTPENTFIKRRPTKTMRECRKCHSKQANRVRNARRAAARQARESHAHV